LAERIRSAVEGFSFAYDGKSIRVTVSIGFAAVIGVPADYDQLKQLAAGALAEAKARGRNRCMVRALP
jgi:diguanylate cyclase